MPTILYPGKKLFGYSHACTQENRLNEVSTIPVMPSAGVEGPKTTPLTPKKTFHPRFLSIAHSRLKPAFSPQPRLTTPRSPPVKALKKRELKKQRRQSPLSGERKRGDKGVDFRKLDSLSFRAPSPLFHGPIFSMFRRPHSSPLSRRFAPPSQLFACVIPCSCSFFLALVLLGW